MKSFFDKLTANNNDFEEDNDLVSIDEEENNFLSNEEEEEKEEEGELSVDIFDKGDSLILKTMIAGVKPEDLEVSISRDSVTIRGSRHQSKEVEKDSYFAQELYWGTFYRKIDLPTEIDIDESSAFEKHGLLTLTLPKVDRERKTTLKIK